MTDQHPITPSFELMNQWYRKACRDPYNGGKFIESKVLKYIATAAAQWGADQELEACEIYLAQSPYPSWAKDLRAARRPKPPSLQEQALDALQSMRISPELIAIINANTDLKDKYETIRCALEAL